jgi:hypothetical protein
MNHERVRKTLKRFFPPSSSGRKGYDKILMFLWLMYKQVMRCSYRDLESITGIDYSTFIKFRQRLKKKQWFSRVFNKLVHLLVAHMKRIHALLDSSFVETYSKHEEQGSAYSGYKKKIGFKLHQIIDFSTRLPLAQEATDGVRADVKIGENLIRGSPRTWNVAALSADKAYDSEYFLFEIRQKWGQCRVAIPLRNMRQSGDPTYNRYMKRKERSKDRSLYKKRTGIERYFSRKKGVFRLGEERTRHLENFRTNCYLTSIMEILEWLAKHPEVGV